MDSVVDLPEEQVCKLTQQFKETRDSSVRESLIQAHMRLARIWGARLSKGRSNKASDIRSVAMLGMIQAIEWAPERLSDDNITPYIVSTIKSFVHRYLREDHLIRIPPMTFAKLIKEKEITELPCTVFSIHQFTKRIKDEDSDAPSEDISLATAATPSTIIDDLTINELLELLDLNEMEEAILDLRMQSKTIVEIAEEVEVSRAWVHRLLNEIGARFKILSRLRT